MRLDTDCDDMGQDGVVAMDLLARARLLCAAANQLALPTLVGPRKASKEIQPEREEDRSSILATCGTRVSKLPLVVTNASGKRRTRTAQAGDSHVDSRQATALPLPEVHVTTQWKQQRESEKIRQAQERARGRLLLRKSNQVMDQCAEQDRSGSTMEERTDCDYERELAKNIQIRDSRMRAEARVRQRRRMAEQQLQQQHVEEHPDLVDGMQQAADGTKQLERFHQKTIRRLHAATLANQTRPNREQQQEQAASHARLQDGPGSRSLAHAARISVNLADDTNTVDEKEQRLREKRRRRETAERMRRQKQAAEQVQRDKQERFDQGLEAFKSMRKEMERVAKGLGTQRRPSATSSAGHLSPASSCDKIQGAVDIPHTEETPEIVSRHRSPSASPVQAIEHNPIVERRCPTNDGEKILNAPIASSQTQDEDVGSLIIATEPPHTEVGITPQQPSTNAGKSRRRRLPAWKLAPVPILPTECYSYKATVTPGTTAAASIVANNRPDSYASRHPAYHPQSASIGNRLPLLVPNNNENEATNATPSC